MGLTEDAKSEIAAAIRIVREDKFEQHARGVFAKFAPKEKEKDELIDDDAEKEKGKVTPPPEKEKEEKEVKPEKEEKPARHSAYWGEILD